MSSRSVSKSVPGTQFTQCRCSHGRHHMCRPHWCWGVAHPLTSSLWLNTSPTRGHIGACWLIAAPGRVSGEGIVIVLGLTAACQVLQVRSSGHVRAVAACQGVLDPKPVCVHTAVTELPQLALICYYTSPTDQLFASFSPCLCSPLPTGWGQLFPLSHRGGHTVVLPNKDLFHDGSMIAPPLNQLKICT
jgi:hypothetical protein